MSEPDLKRQRQLTLFAPIIEASNSLRVSEMPSSRDKVMGDRNLLGLIIRHLLQLKKMPGDEDILSPVVHVFRLSHVCHRFLVLIPAIYPTISLIRKACAKYGDPPPQFEVVEPPSPFGPIHWNLVDRKDEEVRYRMDTVFKHAYKCARDGDVAAFEFFTDMHIKRTSSAALQFDNRECPTRMVFFLEVLLYRCIISALEKGRYAMYRHLLLKIFRSFLNAHSAVMKTDAIQAEYDKRRSALKVARNMMLHRISGAIGVHGRRAMLESPTGLFANELKRCWPAYPSLEGINKAVLGGNLDMLRYGVEIYERAVVGNFSRPADVPEKQLGFQNVAVFDAKMMSGHAHVAACGPSIAIYQMIVVDAYFKLWLPLPADRLNWLAFNIGCALVRGNFNLMVRMEQDGLAIDPGFWKHVCPHVVPLREELYLRRHDTGKKMNKKRLRAVCENVEKCLEYAKAQSALVGRRDWRPIAHYDDEN